MHMWERPDDLTGFEDWMARQVVITTEMPRPEVPVGLEERCRLLSARLAREQQTVQALVRQNDDLRRQAHSATVWPFLAGLLVPIVSWVASQVVWP